jgi:hypothetical protein
MMGIDTILSLKPCGNARAWLNENRGKSLYTLWRTCQRGDWLLWLAVEIGIDRKLAVLAACDCADQVKHLVPESVRDTTDIVRKWCSGEATLDEVRAASDAASAAYAAASAAYAAADAAADAAASAAYAAAYAADAASAAYAAADAAAYAAYAAASLANSARLVRKRMPWSVWKAALNTQTKGDE